MQAVPGLLTGDYWCVELLTLLLVLMFSGKSKYKITWYRNLLMGKSGASIIISIKLRQLGDTWIL